ncbi:uncharacterized protein DS421_13g405700 [Arachis hypogaea]|nr:uncharacterized protein DS421_13g405700 [Arachis hypogaea]
MVHHKIIKKKRHTYMARNNVAHAITMLIIVLISFSFDGFFDLGACMTKCRKNTQSQRDLKERKICTKVCVTKECLSRHPNDKEKWERCFDSLYALLIKN